MPNEQSMSVLQFPANRRAGEVKRCADALQKLNGEEANRFWRSQMSLFAAELRELGASEEEISRQAGSYMWAVQAELELLFIAEGKEAALGGM
jgi:hypothetical protein